MQNLMALFIFTALDEKNSFLGKFSPKNQNCQCKLKFGTYTNSNMQNSMVVFISSVLDRNHTFWVKLVRISKFANLKFDTSTNSNIQNLMVLFTFSVLDGKQPFWENLVRNIQIVSLSWNLVTRLTRIWTHSKIHRRFVTFWPYLT